MPKYLIYKEDETVYFLIETINSTTLGYDKIHPNNYPLRIIKRPQGNIILAVSMCDTRKMQLVLTNIDALKTEEQIDEIYLHKFYIPKIKEILETQTYSSQNELKEQPDRSGIIIIVKGHVYEISLDWSIQEVKMGSNNKWLLSILEGMNPLYKEHKLPFLMKTWKAYLSLGAYENPQAISVDTQSFHISFHKR